MRESLGGGFGLAPNGMQVLDARGLADAVKEMSSPVLEHRFRNDRGRTLARYFLSSAERFGQPMVALRRAALQDVLSDAVRCSGIRVETGRRLVGIEG